MCNCWAFLFLTLHFLDLQSPTALTVLISPSGFLSQLQMPLKGAITLHKADGHKLDSHRPLQPAHTCEVLFRPAQLCTLLGTPEGHVEH